jgi:PAS domain S-box-containing protein
MLAFFVGLALMIPSLYIAILPWIFAILVGAILKLPPVAALVFSAPTAAAASLLLLMAGEQATALTLTTWKPTSPALVIASHIGAALTFAWVGTVKIRHARSQEVALEQSEARFRGLIDRVAVGMFIIRDDVLIDVNAMALRLLGAESPGQVIGRSTEELFDERRQDISTTSSITLRGIEDKETKIRTLDEVERVVEFSSMVVNWKNEPATLLAAFDLTERNWAQRERDRLQAQIRHAQKLETIGLLAGGIAHDFNNILQAILANTELLLTQGSVEKRVEDRLHKVAIAAQRGASLVAKMLAYAGRGQNELTSVNLSELA